MKGVIASNFSMAFSDKLHEIYSRLKTTSGSLYEDALKFDEILTADRKSVV